MHSLVNILKKLLLFWAGTESPAWAYCIDWFTNLIDSRLAHTRLIVTVWRQHDLDEVDELGQCSGELSTMADVCDFADVTWKSRLNEVLSGFNKYNLRVEHKSLLNFYTSILEAFRCDNIRAKRMICRFS